MGKKRLTTRRKTLIKVGLHHCIHCSFSSIDTAQFLVDDDDGDTLDEFHYASNDRPSIRLNHAEEAAEVLQQAQAIVQRYVSQREISLPDNEFGSQPMHQAAQRNMDMYCIDVPVSVITRYTDLD